MVDNSIDANAKIEMLEKKARELRRKVIEVLGNSTGGHYGCAGDNCCTGHHGRTCTDHHSGTTAAAGRLGR